MVAGCQAKSPGDKFPNFYEKEVIFSECQYLEPRAYDLIPQTFTRTTVSFIMTDNPVSSCGLILGSYKRTYSFTGA